MKFLILFLLLLSFGCSSSNFYNEHPFVYIEFDIPDKLLMNEDIPLKFKVTNNENVDIVLQKGYLTYYLLVTDSCLGPLMPNWLEERLLIVAPITIRKNSQSVIESEILPFNKFNFEIDKSYIIQAKYQNYDTYSDSIFTFVGEIGPYLKKIKFYKQ